MRHFALLLVLAAAAIAGPNNPGPGRGQVQPLWSTPTTVTTAGLTTTASYPIGLDQQVTLDITIGNASASSTVTLTALFEFDGGNTAGYPVEDAPSEQYVWVQGLDPATFHFDVYPTHGDAKLYLSAITDDTDGVSITARALGR